MINILLFMIGFAIGVVVLNFIYFKIVDYIAKKDYKKFLKWWNDPNTEEFIYNEEGEKIWSNKKGCIGPATYIKQ